MNNLKIYLDINLIKNNLIIFIYYLSFYFIGILIKYLNFNIFESHLFTTLIIIYGFLSSNLFNILDTIHPYETINIIYNLSKKNKSILYISCIPFYKLLLLSYIDVDPIIIQLLNCLRIGINPILYSLYYKKYFLLNYIIVFNILINITWCIIPFIFNDNFSLKINGINIGLFGLINSLSSILLSSINNVINETFINIYNSNYTFIIYTFIITDMIFSIVITPIIIFIYYLLNNNFNNLILINNLYIIFIYSFIIGLLYGPCYIIITQKYLHLSSLNMSIINNIILICSIVISCILRLSIFYYLYIPAIILIFISSIIIIYKSENIKKNIGISNITDII
jgi:hypothetical protein